ncbi:hypothetical protein [Spirosoma fluviale]|uniref:Uncharacterized protein n=1 Tax=Spirosoma fluviale TaxID=1597977 RepID=A0A286GLT0_9BACT|nr:hypothetical protein [Spirosoma fluviale]SOD96470.1 hypothetical protein SAMN06269250_5325 [Spirosoma fluviale]
MIITFAQYCILTATYGGATACEVQRKTTLNQLMIDYYLNGLLKSELVEIAQKKAAEPLCYKVSELGLDCIDDYERANSELVIRRATYEVGRI